MNRRSLLLSALSFPAVRALAEDAAAPNQLTAAEKRAGWKLLFDGRTLKGWRGYKLAGPPERGWTVKDGCLHNPQSNGRPNGSGGDLMTVGVYTDFEFQCDWKISPEGNSGIYYFVRERTEPGPKMYRGDDGLSAVGHEYQLLDDERHPDAKNGPDRTTAALYSLIPPQGKHLRPVGEFNTTRLVVRGEHVEHWLNGEKVVEYELGSPELLARVNASKYKEIPDFGKKRPTPLLLQDHGCEIDFRNVKIRELRP